MLCKESVLPSQWGPNGEASWKSKFGRCGWKFRSVSRVVEQKRVKKADVMANTFNITMILIWQE